MHNQTLNKYLILIVFIALFILPELNNIHYDPQPQFWAEITSAWAIVGLFSIVCLRFTQITIPSIVIPLFAFGLYILIQPFQVNIQFPGLSYVTAIEMLLCIMLAVSINSIKENYGFAALITYLCYIILSGAILQSVIGFIQYTGTYPYFGTLIFYDPTHPTTNIFGHFGQRNHYAHYLSWAAFGAVYLYHQRKISSSFFYPLLLWLSFSLTLSASRSVFIYFTFALIISIVYYITKPNPSKRSWLKLIFIAIITLVAVEYFFPLIHQAFSPNHNISSGLERIATNDTTGRRGVEWMKAWLVFKQHPLFGVGWNEYARQSVLLHHLFPNAANNDGLFTNCHNLILQLLAETGIIGTIIAVLGISIAIYRILRFNMSIEAIVLMCMLATTLAHSMDEYPLWYLYFLAGMITFLAADKPIASISSNLVCKISAVPVAILIYAMVVNSFIFDTLVSYYDTPDKQQDFNKNALYLQNLVDHNRFWAYYAIYSLDNYINVDTDYTNKLYSLKTQMYYTHKFDNFHPYPDSLIKEGMLAWNLGDKAKAKELVKTALIAFPVYKASYQESLKAKKYAPLLAIVK